MTRGAQKAAYQNLQYRKRKWMRKLSKMGFTREEAAILVERYI